MNLSRVVWSEGMYLGTHHFQAQNRYFEDSVHYSTSNLFFEPFGFSGYELDAEALRNGTVALVHARGLFPDGLSFHMPEFDEIPEPRNILDAFPAMDDSLGLYLAVPERHPDGLNCALSDVERNLAVRYIAEEKPLPDENTGRDVKLIRLGRKNIPVSALHRTDGRNDHARHRTRAQARNRPVHLRREIRSTRVANQRRASFNGIAPASDRRAG